MNKKITMEYFNRIKEIGFIGMIEAFVLLGRCDIIGRIKE